MSHDAGHPWSTILGLKGDPHSSLLHILSYLFLGGGFLLLSSTWNVLYRAQRKHRLAMTGAYAYVRHPQYVAFIAMMFAFLLVADHPDAGDVPAAGVNSDLSAAVHDQLPRLRLIATRSTGYDHIDLGRCAARGIAVANVPDYGDHTVAEHAFALLLAVSRRIVAAAERTRRGDFSQEGLRGFDLHGRTLGVVGTGRIGRRAIAIGRGFGMRVLAYDPRPDPAAAETLGFRYAPLEALLTEADAVTLHVPGGTGTRLLLSDAEFARMKAGAVLVNTARGSVVDAAALVRALDSGRLAGAGLDVLPEEPLVRDEAQIFRSEPVVGTERLRALLAGHALLRFPHVVITPHIAYDTDEALHRILDTTLANIEAFARGEPLNLVPLPAAPS